MLRPAFLSRALVALVFAGLMAGCAGGAPLADQPTPSASTGGPSTTPAQTPTGHASTTSNGSTTEIVTGVVLAEPGCPGPAVAESPCPGRPVPDAPVEIRAGGRLIITVTTDKNGAFSLRLAPGTYEMTARNSGFHSQATYTVVVPLRSALVLIVDSGMR
jgi:carboxypeptidase family protein